MDDRSACQGAHEACCGIGRKTVPIHTAFSTLWWLAHEVRLALCAVVAILETNGKRRPFSWERLLPWGWPGVENMPRWVSGVSRVRLLSDKVKSGAKFSLDYAQGARRSAIDFKVVEFEPPVRFATKTVRGPFSFPFKGTLELRAVGDSTEVTNNVETGDESLSSRLANVVFGPILQRSVRRRLHDATGFASAGVSTGEASGTQTVQSQTGHALAAIPSGARSYAVSVTVQCGRHCRPLFAPAFRLGGFARPL